MAAHGDQLDALQDALKRSLGDLEQSIGSIHDGSFQQDPQRLLDSLGPKNEALDELLSQLTSTLEELTEVSPVEINQLVRRALPDLLARVGYPLIVSSRLDSSMPAVEAPVQPLHAAIERVLDVAGSHAGPGGQISVRTSSGEETAELYLDAEPHERDPQRELTGESLRMRCASVDQFIQDLGGGFQAEVEESGRLHILVQLSTRVEAG